MNSPYARRIQDYCDRNGIEVPSGFGRDSASRYAVVRCDKEPRRLVARTWFLQSDVVYFLREVLAPELGVVDGPLPVKILDFKDSVQLSWEGGKRLVRGAAFSSAS